LGGEQEEQEVDEEEDSIITEELRRCARKGDADLDWKNESVSSSSFCFE
jgi:hypothetical protein